MSKHQRNGGSAFPTVKAESPAEAQVGTFVTVGDDAGMSLRDYFAAQAVAGLVQFADAPTKLNPAEMADAAYNIADAMLNRREVARVY